MTATLPRRVVVSAGPTISASEIRQRLPGAEVVAPIAFGHIYSYGLWAGDTLLVIDGLFLQQPAVRHRELLELIDEGVRVAGCSSMGALRAAELAPFGMLGYGQIFHAYRTGQLQADDEVAMVHGHADAGYPVIIDALVNLRATVTAAAGGGLITTSLAERILTAAQGLPFTHRSWQQLLPQAGVPVDQVATLSRRLRRARVDAKRRDAITALTELRRHSPATAGPQGSTRQVALSRPPATLWTQRWAEQRRRSSQSPVTDAQVVAFLRLFSTDHWTILPALEQFAAWHHDLHGGDPTPSVRDRAELAIRDLPHSPTSGPPDRTRALGLLTHQHMQDRGLITAAGWPQQVLAGYLDPDELAAAAADPVLGSTLLAPRVLHRQPMLPDTRHAAYLVRTDPRFDTWAGHAAAWVAIGDQLAVSHPELNLSRPDPDALALLFGKLWSTEHLHAELGRRGFSSLQAFQAAAAPFAAAAATEPWPGILIGLL